MKKALIVILLCCIVFVIASASGAVENPCTSAFGSFGTMFIVASVMTMFLSAGYIFISIAENRTKKAAARGDKKD